MTRALNSGAVRAEAQDMTAPRAVASAGSVTGLRIPRVLHRIWLGDAPMPEAYAAYGETWAREHPEWELKLWTDANRPALRNEASFAAAGTLAQKADILRYELLLAEGGIYVDCDFECRRNIEPLLDGLDAFVVPECDTWIAIGILGAVAGHPFLEALVDAVPDGIAGAPGRPPNEQTGPFLMTRMHGEWEEAGRPAPAKLAPALFYPYGPAERHRASEPFPEAYGIHHWGSSWVAEEDRPKQVGPVRRVVIAPDWEALAPAAAVSRVACTLFGPADSFELAFAVPAEPDEADGAAISALLAESAPDPSCVPDAVVYAFGEAVELPHDVALVEAGDTVGAGIAAADAIAAMVAIRAAFDGGGSLPEPAGGAALGERLAERLAGSPLEAPAAPAPVIVEHPALPAIVEHPAATAAPAGTFGCYVGNDRVLVRPAHGGRLLASASDISITPYLVCEGGYDLPFTAFLQRTLRAGDVAIDVGANIGLFTILMGHLVGASGRVLAYEPVPETFALLRDNIALNWHDRWVEAIPKAASATAGIARLHAAARLGMLSSLRPLDIAGTPGIAVDDVRVTDVETEPLDVHCGRFARIALVKIDVEGGEHDVLRGMRGLLASGAVERVSFELLRDRVGDDWEGLAALLRGYGEAGWRFSLIAEDGSPRPDAVERLLDVGEFTQVVMERPQP